MFTAHNSMVEFHIKNNNIDSDSLIQSIEQVFKEQNVSILRVYEISKHLNTTSKRLLETLIKKNILFKNHMSLVFFENGKISFEK